VREGQGNGRSSLGSHVVNEHAASRQRELERIYSRSEALLDEQCYDENQALLREAIVRFPDVAELCLRTAASYLGSAEEEAKRLVRHAAELEPSDPWLLARGATLMLDLLDFESAEQYAREAKAFAPEDFVFASDITHILGRVAYHRENYGEAQTLLTAAYEKDPHIPEHGAWLAQFHYQQGDPIKALEILSDALRHCPDNALLKEVRSDVLEYVQLDERDD